MACMDIQAIHGLYKEKKYFWSTWDPYMGSHSYSPPPRFDFNLKRDNTSPPSLRIYERDLKVIPLQHQQQIQQEQQQPLGSLHDLSAFGRR